MRTRITALCWAGCLLAGFQSAAHGQTGDGKAKPDVPSPPAAQAAEFTRLVYLNSLYSLAQAGDGNARLLNWSQSLAADLAAADAPLRSQLKLKDGEGFVVIGLTQDGPGAEAGLQVNDVVVGLNDEPKPEATYPVYLWRSGLKQPATVRLKTKQSWWIGVNLAEIDDAMRSQLSLAAGRGLLVSEVTEDSPAAKAGIQKFDVIDGSGDGTASGTVAEFSAVVQNSGGKTLSLQILRHGKSLTIGVTPQKRPAQAAVTTDAARWLLLSQVQPQWNVEVPNYPLRYLGARRAALAIDVPADRQTKLAAVEKQLDQLLKDVQATRDTLEELRKLEARNKEKSTPEKK